MLNNGTWTEDWQPIQKKDREGRFLRQKSTVRNWVTPDGAPGPTGHGGFAAEAGRYHLYVALICPWACRTLFARKILGLEEALEVTVVNPVMTSQGWGFGGFPRALPDPLYGSTYLHQLYTRHDPRFSGRASVPILWDKQRQTMVNNESADILRMLHTAFAPLAKKPLDLYPPPLQKQIDDANDYYYEQLNNGVYRAGFASSQQAYEEAYDHVFAALDDLEGRLEKSGPYYFDEALTETDIRLFVTLVRFDAAYHGLFKCNRNRLTEFRQIPGYLQRLYRLPGVAETVDFDHIKSGYYNIRTLNPGGIVPVGPEPALFSSNV